MGSSGASHAITKTKKKVNEIFSQGLQGPIQGLQMAPEFFQMLQSPELANTPLGQSLQAQSAVFQNVIGSLTGDQTFAGQLPADLASSISEQLTSAQAARGTFGSPAGAIEAGLRFSGASESIRQSRIASALSAIERLGGGAIFPSASQFLQTGAGLAESHARLRTELGLQEAGIAQQESAQRGQLIGRALGGVLGLATGGIGGLLLGSGLSNQLIGGSSSSLNQPFAGLFSSNPAPNFNLGPGAGAFAGYGAGTGSLFGGQ